MPPSDGPGLERTMHICVGYASADLDDRESWQAGLL